MNLYSKMLFKNHIRCLNTSKNLPAIIKDETKEIMKYEEEKKDGLKKLDSTEEKIYYHIPGPEQGNPQPWQEE